MWIFHHCYLNALFYNDSIQLKKETQYFLLPSVFCDKTRRAHIPSAAPRRHTECEGNLIDALWNNPLSLILQIHIIAHSGLKIKKDQYARGHF